MKISKRQQDIYEFIKSEVKEKRLSTFRPRNW